MVNCNKCFKYYNAIISGNCSFCQKYGFQENILCDLTRAIHNSNEVKCFAFKPNISIVGGNKEIFEAVPNSDNDKELTERHKWLKAYAVQQLKSNPDQMICNLNFHVCLVTTNRENLLESIVGELSENFSIFQNAGDKYDSKVNLLSVDYDHIHLLINTTPVYSVDEMINNVIEHLNSGIKNEFPDLFGNKKVIFEKSYFCETIG
ncbi:MAG: transposase [Burkholderiales bacterium]|nr:transposase [Burkholderiales bacterium]